MLTAREIYLYSHLISFFVISFAKLYNNKKYFVSPGNNNVTLHRKISYILNFFLCTSYMKQIILQLLYN